MPGKPTVELYQELQKAYDYFNRELFGNELPDCMITLQRNNKAYAMHYRNNWFTREDEKIDEIAINPDYILDRKPIEVLSGFAHEMVHLWQFEFGNAGKNGYHNKEWAEKMKSIGLHPSHNGKPEGNETGYRMSHFIIPDSDFEKASQNILLNTKAFNYVSYTKPKPKTKQGSKTKYTCPSCESNVWGKSDLKIYCFSCKEHFVQQG